MIRPNATPLRPRCAPPRSSSPRRGRRRIGAKLAALAEGAGTRLVVDYSALGSSRLGMAFSPFGITVVDSVRTFFEQVPIQFTFPDRSELVESNALPILRDSHRREVSCRLEKPISRAQLTRLLGGPAALTGAPRPFKLDLSDLRLDLKRARLRWNDGTIRATLVAVSTDSSH